MSSRLSFRAAGVRAVTRRGVRSTVGAGMVLVIPLVMNDRSFIICGVLPDRQAASCRAAMVQFGATSRARTEARGRERLGNEGGAMVRWIPCVLSLILVLGGSAAPVGAQSRATSADLTGLVQDASQALVSGATVTATNVATRVSRAATTSERGRYTIPALPPGTYSVTVEHAGFAAEVREDVSLELGATVAVDVVLQVAGAREAVTVRTTPPLVDTRETSVATVVSERQIESLPTNGRNFIAFALLTPGVSTDRTPQQGASATSGLTFGGQRARSNNLTVDGLDNNDATIGGVRATFSQEAVREFQVLASSYSAEFGKASGGLVNIVTKSGTNSAAGDVFFYVRDDGLNAKNYFEKFDPAGTPIEQDKAPYAQQQYGGILGGPIRRDRAFFFTSFERLDIDASNFVTIDDRTPLRVLGASPCTDPSALCTPARLINDTGFPVDVGHVPSRMETNTFLVKIDHHIRNDQALTLRYNYGDAINENIEPFGGIVARSRGAILDSTDQVFAASHTAVVSNRMVHELRFQYARRDQDVNALDPACGGPCVGENQGGPTVEITGVASFGRHRFTPQPRLNERYQVVDTLSVISGRHQIKTGFDFNYIDHLEQALPLHFGGRYIFTELDARQAASLGVEGPLSAIQAFALGLPVRYIQGYGSASKPYTYGDLSLFVEDEWRVDAVTLKLGLRYQRQFWPDVTYSVAGVAEPYGFPSDSNNIAPRVALAWDPSGTGMANLHVAWGVFFDNHITGMLGIADIVNGDPNGVRTLVAPPPTSLVAWRAPERRLSEAGARGFLGAFPSLEIAIDPGLQTPHSHQASIGIDHELPGQMAVAINYVFVRGFNQVGTIDYNPIVPALGPNRRPLDVAGVPGTSASLLQYTSYGHTWYQGISVALRKRFSHQTELLASYTLSKAEDDTTDFQTTFLPENNGRGRDPKDPTGVPLGFDPERERGPSLQDQRHRLVFSGLVVIPGDVHLSSIVTLASGRPYSILAGVDLNGDGDGGAFPPDRPRTGSADPAASLGRNAGVLPMHATVDLRIARRFPLGDRVKLEGFFEVFNLFNRANYTDVQNIFGPGRYPTNPLPTFGQFTQAAPPLQVQIAAKVLF
ncbi:MAG: TonB-dependent receptor [Luteitalea sp.]|nr:TonB-dependent receptor [Luteitalea sp.]